MKRGGVVLGLWGRAFDPENATYDELGRLTQRQIGTPANTQTQTIDSLGRLITLNNPLGAFAYTYEGLTGRPTSLTYPSGQQTTYAYFDNLGDRRLREIHNKRPGGATLSKFNYTYDVAGNILTWEQQADSDPARVLELAYDSANQLTAAILKSTDPTPQVLQRYYYAYDPAGNRSAEQVDDAVTAATYNNMNQLATQQAGGSLVFKGIVSEPASVTIAGRPASVTPDNHFQGQATVPSGTGQVAITASDPSGNMRTSTYQVNQTGAGKTFTYDANGNMTSDGTRTYEWDAENRLSAVKEGAAALGSYTYDANGARRSKSTPTGVTTYVHDGSAIVEERGEVGNVTTHFHAPAIDNPLASRDASGAVAYYASDHLGSVRDVTGSAGTRLLNRNYDPWGRPSTAADVGGYAFTGREWNPESRLYYYRARYYSAALGRFVSEDPSAQQQNLYGYVSNSPTVGVDPSGLMGVRNMIRPQIVLQRELPSDAVAKTDIGSSMTNICVPEGGGCRLTSVLNIYGTMKLPLHVERRPKEDPTVTDTDSAKTHEYEWHINIAIEAVNKIVAPEEGKVQSQGECCDTCSRLNKEGPAKFDQVIAKTRTDERTK
jgi:RHS repeat-associated protein